MEFKSGRRRAHFSRRKRINQPTLPIERIKNDVLRRSALLVDFPMFIHWHFNCRHIVLPLAVMSNAEETAIFAAMRSVRGDFTTRPLRLLASSWERLWRAPAIDTSSSVNKD